MKDKKILIIIPAYNEEYSILNTYLEVVEYNKKHHTNYDVIVINDGSTDETKNICQKYQIPTIDLIHNLGIGGAVQTGYKYAYNHGYDIAVQFDGDGQHDIRYVKKIVLPIINDEADMVIGSRFINKESKSFKSTATRRIGIKIISIIIKLVSGKKIYDTTSGFRACSKKLIKEFSEDYPNEYPEPITNALVAKKKYRIKEIEANMYERQGGTSSINAWKNIYYMINVSLALIAIKFRRYK